MKRDCTIHVAKPVIDIVLCYGVEFLCCLHLMCLFIFLGKFG